MEKMRGRGSIASSVRVERVLGLGRCLELDEAPPRRGQGRGVGRATAAWMAFVDRVRGMRVGRALVIPVSAFESPGRVKYWIVEARRRLRDAGVVGSIYQTLADPERKISDGDVVVIAGVGGLRRKASNGLPENRNDYYDAVAAKAAGVG